MKDKITQQQIEAARREVMESLARYDELVRKYLEDKLKEEATD